MIAYYVVFIIFIMPPLGGSEGVGSEGLTQCNRPGDQAGTVVA